MTNPDPTLDIDPESEALQYRIVEANGRWVLLREYGDMPRTPDETVAIQQLKVFLPKPIGGGDRFVVPQAARKHLDAGPGDVVSIVAVAGAQAQVITEAMKDAINPWVEALNEVGEAMAEAIREGFSDTTDDGEDVGRLPESIREARRRREEQREGARESTGWHQLHD